MAGADLSQAFELLSRDPARSEKLCREALARDDDPSARLLLAAALRLQGRFGEARAFAAALAGEAPLWSGAQFEHGLALAGLERHAEALDAFRRVEGLGGLPGLARAVGDQHWAMGARDRAEAAYLRHLAAQTPEPPLQMAMQALQRGDKAQGEEMLRRQLAQAPGDVMAMRVLAELNSAEGRFAEAEPLLRALLERAPSYALGRYGLAMVLFHDHQLAGALVEIERLLNDDPKRFEFLSLKAETLSRLGDYGAAKTALENTLQLYPQSAETWTSLGHVERGLGAREASEAAYQKAIVLKPSLGDAYWGLANLKTFKFRPEWTEAMRAQELRTSGADRVALQFALGKALEDGGEYSEAFRAYERANAGHRAQTPYDQNERVEATQRARVVFTPKFFAERKGVGSTARDPIFIVGMPRSGSTLVEQILASHSQVEGTMELIELLSMTRSLEREGPYPEQLSDKSTDAFLALGQEYLDRSRVFRKTDAPRFIDKMPNNFTQTGLIQLILPNATIIDVRRHPLACCFSIFKQHWGTGQTFAYDLADIGAFYRNYVELMAHFDVVLPGRVHRVIYEELVANPEAETRRLLDAAGLQFEESCLRFYENKRTVRTPSSEQVRRPINSDGLKGWRPFEQWLGPLKEALGPVLDAYPEAPRLPPL